MIETGLKGKVALITGGNNPYGIGAATAKAFAVQGAMVFIHYFRTAIRSSKDESGSEDIDTPGVPFFLAMQTKSADDVVEGIRKQGGEADSWECNLADPESIPELFERAERRFGPVEVLVNNAADYQADTFLPGLTAEGGGQALWEEGPLKFTITAESHDRHFAVNTRAVALMMAEFTRRHIEGERNWGRIINISADCAWGCPGEISYRASKYALESFSRSAAAELGPFGIAVNIVSPGPIQTGYITSQVEEKLVHSIPLRRVGRPEDVANLIVFLASEQASWVTGQLIWIHGGHRMSMDL
ncbi:MAG: SDR family oxidoreductase [Candidatus Latescibacteria bacterium]|nr:SDR family oxidoreductase [Candidatus Latescibacterota bacterium]NIO27116.1 SDR family oxidoreductase [Candidatus Latescibacterota bacterium]NIO54640.1 SDR family oxidoreductase [Candidatus Latescibacterota bacterium]NIT00723.1 SDR family oxidoreductase [Candidatus Latescibacterota bacterium]NIT37646.1 SDR family oxidoreductase [Candidatus Latescibacterota bacterium]